METAACRPAANGGAGVSAGALEEKDGAGSWFAPPDGQSSAAGAQALPFLGQSGESLGHLLAREMVDGGKLRLVELK
ncbi:hypothetical protein KTAU_29390 [Thermogemmatispora aurantia]|nr:hypothetical protein KTAU_29390 [Thermogemmatispora aurantia]